MLSIFRLSFAAQSIWFFLVPLSSVLFAVSCAPSDAAGTSAVPSYGSMRRDAADDGPRDAPADVTRDAPQDANRPDETEEDAGASDVVEASLVDERRDGGGGWQSVGFSAWSGCGLRNGVVFCWGDNHGAELGNGEWSEEPAIVPGPVAGSVELVQLSVGGESACGLDREGKAYCWGANDFGQIAGATASCSTWPKMPCLLQPTPVLPDLTFKQIRVGRTDGCGIDFAGNAYCWGASTGGGPDSPTDAGPPMLVPGGPYAAISPSQEFTCAIDVAGHAFCWKGIEEPVPVSGDLVFSSISASAVNACGVTINGDGYCWGDNMNGVSGGSDPFKKVPIALPKGATFRVIEGSLDSACGITTTGDVYCWGLNIHGALGQGTEDDSSDATHPPVRVPGLPPVKSLAVSDFATCVVSEAGDRYCWGMNLYAHLGDGTTVDRLSPELVP
jgi:hypothetical protein